MNVSGSITVGYGVSGNASYSKSKVNADYASVNEQSGIFAGDDGYQIHIKNHTDLTGGLITSTANAEQNGKNSFATGTLTFADLANKAEYSGNGFGIGVSGTIAYTPNNNLINVANKYSLSSDGIGYGHDSQSQQSVSKSGINTANIVITDKNKQQQITGKTAEETIKAVKTNITLENHQNLSGRLDNNFDAKKVQSEIDLQVEVTKGFSNNVRDFQSKQNKRLDELKEKKDKGEISPKEYQEQAQKIEQQKLITNVVAGGLLSPTDSLTGIAVSAVSPAVSHEIGQYFKGLADQNPNGELTASQKTAHIAAHAILGAVTANANGGNALSGALSAGGAEAIAPVISSMLYKKTNPENLTAEQKETVSTVAQAIGTLSGSVTGDNSLDAYVGGTVATNAVENNVLRGRVRSQQSETNSLRAQMLEIHRNEIRKIIPDFNGLPVARNMDRQGRGIITQSEVDDLQQFANWLKTQPRGLSEQEYIYNFRMSKTNIPPNLSPIGAGRSGAFSQVKRDFNILSSRQPEFVTPNYDRKGNIQPGRTYYFPTGRVINNGIEYTVIRDDAAGHFPYYPYSHFNVSTQYLNQMREPVAKPINHNVHYDYPSK